MDSAIEGIPEREHVAERFEEFARKLVEATKPAKPKKRPRTARKR
jgi:hypothetical protein